MPNWLWLFPIVATAALVFGIAMASGRNADLAGGSLPQGLPTTPQPQGQVGDWYLLFNDEFDGTSLNLRNWHTCYWWSEDGCTNAGNNELQWYQPGQVTVENGTLRLRADEREAMGHDGEEFPYSSGMVSTGRHRYETSYRPRFSFQYGYVEMRARIPSGDGLWPAFWMLPVTHYQRPEIDIMEVLGHESNVVHMHLHYLEPSGAYGSSQGHWQGPDFSEGWHTYALHWEPDAITWYIDGVERRHVDDPALIPSVPMYLLLNLAVGGDWPGEPTSATQFPALFEIDYVRVWKRANAIHPGDIWRYFKGQSEPPEYWNTLGFDDSDWPSGPSGFGFGNGDDATILWDMPRNYTSVYIRRHFTVGDPDGLQSLMLAVDYEDGFVAYINGTEVARANIEGDPPAHDARALSEDPASLGTGSIAAFDLTEFRHLLVPGTNVIAIQGHNVSSRGSNFSLIPTLIAVEEPRGSSAPLASAPGRSEE